MTATTNCCRHQYFHRKASSTPKIPIYFF